MKFFAQILVMFILVTGLASNLYAQSSAVSSITISAAANALTIVNSDGGVDDVLRNTTYTVVFDAYAGASTVSPNFNGEAISGDVGVDIAGDPDANVAVEMDLPSELSGVGGVFMPITFPASGPGSGVRAETGAFFNPNVANVFNLGAGTTATLRLGYTFTVPPDITIAGEIYTGQILINAYYTGL